MAVDVMVVGGAGEGASALAALVSPAPADVTSGVEFQTGMNDPARVRRFLEAVVAKHAAL